MANEETNDEIIIIEDSEAAGISQKSDNKQQEIEEIFNSSFKKQTILIIIGSILILIIIGSVVILLLHHSKRPAPLVPSIFTSQTKPGYSPNSNISSKIEKMIKKAGYLYNHNHKNEALILYKRIAKYNEALSRYNLGVAQLKANNYKKALSTFKQALRNHDKMCVSAINAAVCSLHLHQTANFKYYINLAYAYLPAEINSPLYYYYYALIKYYKRDYLEALAALNHPNSNYYHKPALLLKRKLDVLFGNYNSAIKNYSNNYSQKDALPVGLLYANIHKYHLAAIYLKSALKNKNNRLKAQMALALVDIKSHRYHLASHNLKEVTSLFHKQSYRPYPIKVFLKNTFLNQQSAQKYYRYLLNNSVSMQYLEIFHFAPYKIFHPTATIENINKGNINIYLNDIKSAQKYLRKSQFLSTINFTIANAIDKAILYKIRQANKILKTVQNRYPKDSILQYDLALTYMQLGNIPMAYKHFTTSYYLNSNNYLAGVFSMISAKLLHKDNTQFNKIVKTNIAQANTIQNKYLDFALLDLFAHDYLGASKWLSSTKNNKPIFLILKTIVFRHIHKHKLALKYADILRKQTPQDIVSNLVYINEKLKNNNTINYAKNTLFFIKNHDFNYNAIYDGSYIARYLYAYQSLFTGTIYQLNQIVEHKLYSSTNNIKDIIYTAALTDLLSHKYEQSYVLFNQLTNQYNINNDRTLFLAAVASIAAGHHANAITLLTLAILQNPHSARSHYALGLLYLENKNNIGAAIQFNLLPAMFKSHYFNFNINQNTLNTRLKQTILKLH